MGYKWSKLFAKCGIRANAGFCFCRIDSAPDADYSDATSGRAEIIKKIEKYGASYAVSNVLWTYKSGNPSTFFLVGFRCEKALMKFMLATGSSERVSVWKNRVEFRVRLAEQDRDETGIWNL